MVKNCDRRFENAEAAGRGRHFHARGHSFSPYRPTLSRQITCLFFSYSKFVFAADYKWVCLRNFVIESVCAPSTNDL